MEDIDRIIIHTLRQIGCDLEEDVAGLGHFTTELVVEATTRCLRLVKPGLDLPLSLPPSMSARFRIGASLAQACMDLGYAGDIGYQTFLYSTEADIRRVFMFLIEKLPKETEKAASTPLGQAQLVRQAVCQRLRQQLSMPWLPSKCLHQGVHWLSDDTFMREGFSCTTHFESIPIALSNPQGNCDYNPPPVLNQVLYRNQLLPSLISLNAHCLANQGLVQPYQSQQIKESLQKDWAACMSKAPVVAEAPTPLPRRILPKAEPSPVPTSRFTRNERLQFTKEESVETVSPDSKASKRGEEEIQSLREEIEKLNSRLEDLQLETRSLSAKVSKVSEESESAEQSLRSQEKRFSVQKQTYELLPDADNNIVKLQELVETSAKRLVHLASQWERHRGPLLQNYRELREQNSQRLSESQRQVKAVRSMREKMRELSEEVRSKEQLHKQLVLEYDKVTKDISRSAYTRRILEIIGNIRKQKEEIDRVLDDTRQVQKEINQMTGRLDRSFAVADELIFRDAKKEEAARRAYKLLATLHADCAELVTLVQETGSTMREIRDLEDQIETENSKNVAANLERITADLKQMKQETAALMAQLKSKSS